MQISRQRRWQLKQVAAGNCSLCGKTNDRKNREACTSCKKKATVAKRRRNDYLKSEGLCINCRAKVEYARVLKCSRCRQLARDLYQEHLDQGKCTRCGKKKSNSHRSLCTICADKQQQYGRKYRRNKLL